MARARRMWPPPRPLMCGLVNARSAMDTARRLLCSPENAASVLSCVHTCMVKGRWGGPCVHSNWHCSPAPAGVDFKNAKLAT